MTFSFDDILKGKPEDIAKLFSNLDAGGSWDSRDLHEMLLHQLRTPVVSDLSAAALLQNFDGQRLAAMTFMDLFDDPAPSLQLLEMAKAFAKSADGQPDGRLPPELAMVLYYATIAAAAVRHGVLLTELPPQQVRLGLQWMIARPWLTTELFELGNRAIGWIDAL